MGSFRPGRCRLHAILRERRLTPQEFVDLIGMSKQQISHYATNVKVMSLGTAKTIAHYLEVPIDDLYEWIPRNGAGH